MSVKPALVLGLLSVNAVAYAALVPTDKLTLSAGVSYENSDNIRHSAVNKISENIIHGLLTANYQKRSARINTVFSLNVDRKNYQKKTFTNQTTVSSEFALDATLQKQRLYWDAHNRLARVQINQALPNIPTNQENTNYFSTGPRFVVFRNNKHSLNVDLRYEKFYTEKSNGDYSGYVFDTSYHRNITRTAGMQLGVKYNDRTFDDQLLNANYKRTDFTLGLSKRMKHSLVDVDVGRTLLNYQDRPNTQMGIFRANYQYQPGRLSSIKASYRRELSDFSNVFASAAPGSTPYTDVSGATFILKSGQISIERKFNNASLAYEYVYAGHSYSNISSDTITRASTVLLSDNLGTGLHLKLSASYRNTSFVAGNRVDLARVYIFGLSRSFLDSYDLSLNLQYSNIGSTDSNSIYDERRISLSGHYYFR